MSKTEKPFKRAGAPRVYAPPARGFLPWLNRSIQHKLIFWSIAFWIVSMFALGIMVLLIGQSEITRQTSTRNVQLASVISRDINSQISQAFSDTRTFAGHLEAVGPSLRDQADALLSLKLSSPRRYGSIFYFAADGQLLFYFTDNTASLVSMQSSAEILARPPIDPGPAVSDSFLAARSSLRYISEVSFKGFDLTPVTYMAVPLSFSASISRVVVFEIDLTDIWQRIDLSTVGRSGFTYAVSRQGRIIAYPQPSFLGRQIPVEIGPVVQGFEGYVQYRDPVDGRDIIAAYSPVGAETGWGIVVAQDRAEALAPILQAELIVLGIWLLLALAGTIGIFAMIRNFTRPVLKLTAVARAIAETGDLTRTTGLEEQPDEVGQLSQAFDRMVERLHKSEGRLAQAAAEERNRLARDLHDAVSQTLFSASIIADVLPRLWDRNQTEARKRLEEIRQLTRGALAEMRTLLLELRPASLIEADMVHLMNQLAESVNGRARIPVSVTIEGECKMPNDVKVALYRIAQEALNNVAKHSGASEARLNLVCSPGQVTLAVHDNGRGFSPQSVQAESLGLGIIRERAREIGAELSLDSAIGRGTDITAVWKNPIEQ